MSIWHEEMRRTNRLATKGKGNRRNRRHVTLPRSEFERVSHFDVAHHIGRGEHKPNDRKTRQASAEKVAYIRMLSGGDLPTNPRFKPLEL